MISYRWLLLLCLLESAALADVASSQAADTPPRRKDTGVAAATSVKVDQASLDRALALFDSRKYVDAEKLLREVLSAIDAGKLPQSDPGRCLRPLTDIYRAWGRKNEDALKIALRYRKFISEKLADNPASLNPLLDQNSLDLAGILTELDRASDAEKYLQVALATAEKQTNQNPLRTLHFLVELARLADAQDDSAKAKRFWDRIVELGAAAVKKIEEHQLPADQYPACIEVLAAGYEALENRPKAIAALTQLLKWQTDHNDASATVKTRFMLGKLGEKSGQYAAALPLYEDALATQHQLANQSPQEAELLALIAGIYNLQGASADARRYWDDAIVCYTAIISRIEHAPEAQTQLMKLLDQLEHIYQQSGRHREGIQVCTRLLALRQKALGEDHPLTVSAKSDLGAFYGATGQYQLAKPHLTDARDYWERRTPQAPLKLSRALNDLGIVERDIGSYNEAQELFRRAFQLRSQSLPPDDLQLAQSDANLATVFSAQGEYARAALLFDQAIDIYKNHGTSADDARSKALLNQAMVFKSQGRLPEARTSCNQALAVFQQVFGNDAPGAAAYYNALASISISQLQWADAAHYSDQAWQLCQRKGLDREPIASTTLHIKALVELHRGKPDDARRDWQSARELQERYHQNSQLARTLNYLAKIGQPADSENLYRQALQLQGRIHAYPIEFYLTSVNLAEILYNDGKPDEAVKLVEEAMNVIETPRAGTIGGETERAEYFAQFSSAFDVLVSWNLKRDHISEAFDFAERGRNRTFLDQLNLAGVDLRDTLSGPTGEKLRVSERDLRGKLGTLLAQAQAASELAPTAADRAAATVEKIAAEIETTQKEYARVWAEIRNASPLYRQQLSQESGKLGSFEVVRNALAKMQSLMLFYYVGEKDSYLLVIDPADEKVHVVPLVIPPGLATAMSVKPGPITRSSAVELVNQYLADIRDRAGGRGLGGIVHSEKGVEASEQGTLLADVLVPRAVRNIVEHRGPSNVVIVPDGALDELPFEALLLENRPSPKYLFDVFPPITYAPSANILVNLLDRAAPDASAVATLTVGNPKYPEATGRSLVSATRAAYLGLGGALPALPATAKECQRIAHAFAAGKVTDLEAEQATEKNVRDHIAGTRFIHFAAHGLVDQQNDNLFGAIALTPPAAAVESTDDDGFLSLHDIHNLPLSNCQLAVLSARQTNVGPGRPLEAGSSIAQAFLAAGARRTVCSHWNVDDASTAELIGGFFERIAKAAQVPENDKATVADNIAYAKALHDARMQVRSQPQWSSPYYWAPFVLVGPPQ